MTSIIWQSRTPVVHESFQKGELINAANGGNAYDFHAASVLSEKFEVRIDPAAINNNNESLLNYGLRMRRQKINADVLITEPYPLVFGSRLPGMKTVAMIHHLDERKKDIKHRLFSFLLKKKLRATDLVVTVSAYWEKYLHEIGCKNVKVIYNSFDPSAYATDPETVLKFKIKYGFVADVPIIYIGNASRQKGVYETYEALKNYPYQLVMTGAKNNASDLPVKFLNLSRNEYISLLHASEVVVTLSTLTEGWNRIAHEAMLCKTPVIGSGKGGMNELLTSGGQKIEDNPKLLADAVKSAIQNRTMLGEKGFNYVSQYNLEYFKKEWIEAIKYLSQSKRVS